MSKRLKKHETPPLAVGETWFVRFPREEFVATVEIDELTANTIVVRRLVDVGHSVAGAAPSRWERGDLKFVERVK